MSKRKYKPKFIVVNAVSEALTGNKGTVRPDVHIKDRAFYMNLDLIIDEECEKYKKTRKL